MMKRFKKRREIVECFYESPYETVYEIFSEMTDDFKNTEKYEFIMSELSSIGIRLFTISNLLNKEVPSFEISKIFHALQEINTVGKLGYGKVYFEGPEDREEIIYENTWQDYAYEKVQQLTRSV